MRVKYNIPFWVRNCCRLITNEKTATSVRRLCRVLKRQKVHRFVETLAFVRSVNRFTLHSFRPVQIQWPFNLFGRPFHSISFSSRKRPNQLVAVDGGSELRIECPSFVILV